MVSFDAAHQAVHYPDDRRVRIWVRPSILIGIAIAIFCAVAAAWIQFGLAGLPHIPPVAQVSPNNFSGPHGFPLWVRYCHFFNFFFVMLLIRSGLSILMDHPRLYFNDDCTPGSVWIRFTPLTVPRDRIWTAKDDARYISPLVGTPGYRHTIGIARVWHFINVHGFIATGIVFISMLLLTEQRRRIVPTSPLVLLQAWNTFVHYATFHLTAGAKRVLWIQRVTANCVFHCGFCVWSCGYFDRYRHVAGRGEPVSLVRADLRRQAIGQVHPFPHHVEFCSLPTP